MRFCRRNVVSLSAGTFVGGLALCIVLLVVAQPAFAGECGGGTAAFGNPGEHHAVGEQVSTGFFEPTGADKFSGTVDWGDGKSSHFELNQRVVHTYTKPGTYHVTFSASGTAHFCAIGGGNCFDEACSNSNTPLWTEQITAGGATQTSASEPATNGGTHKQAGTSKQSSDLSINLVVIFGVLFAVVVGAGGITLHMYNANNKREQAVVSWLQSLGASQEDADDVVLNWVIHGQLPEPPIKGGTKFLSPNDPYPFDDLTPKQQARLRKSLEKKLPDIMGGGTQKVSVEG